MCELYSIHNTYVTLLTSIVTLVVVSSSLLPNLLHIANITGGWWYRVIAGSLSAMFNLGTLVLSCACWPLVACLPAPTATVIPEGRNVVHNILNHS